MEKKIAQLSQTVTVIYDKVDETLKDLAVDDEPIEDQVVPYISTSVYSKHFKVNISYFHIKHF